MSDNARLVDGSITRHLIGQTAPMIVGIACIMGVGLLDAFFIGQLGPEPLAAVSFIFPVSVALSSLGVGVMVGVNSVVSRALGRDDRTHACARGVQGLGFSLSVGLVLATTLWLGREPLFRLLQADDRLIPLIGSYIVPYALGLPLLLVAMGANGVLRAQGEAVKSSSILIVMSIVNGILDPILIFGFGPVPAFGMAGAAWATTIAHLAALTCGLILAAHSPLPLDPARFLHGRPLAGMAEIARVGVPAAASNSINPIGLAVLTALLARHGQEVVAAFGAAGRLQSFAVVPLLALSSSIGPITGQNWGAGRSDRARETLLKASVFALAYGLAVALALVLARDRIAQLFSDDPAIAAALADYLLIASWGFFAFGWLVVANGALNAVDKADLAFAVSLGRVAILMVPLAWLATRHGDPAHVFAAELIANLLGGAVAFALAWRGLCGQLSARSAWYDSILSYTSGGKSRSR